MGFPKTLINSYISGLVSSLTDSSTHKPNPPCYPVEILKKYFFCIVSRHYKGIFRNHPLPEKEEMGGTNVKKRKHDKTRGKSLKDLKLGLVLEKLE